VTNTGPSVITNGDVGLSPGTSVVGFPPGVIANGVIHATDAQAEQAQVDATTAYDDIAGRTPDESGIIDLANRVLVPGVYSGDALSLTGALTLNGDSTSVFIIQAASTLITSTGSSVNFIGGANQCNVFWKVGSSATFGPGSTFAGTVIALASITANTGTTVTGRLMARTGAVTLDRTTITRAAACAPRTAIVASTPSSATLAAQRLAAQQAAAQQVAAQRAAATAAANAAALRARLAARAAASPSLAATGTESAPILVGGVSLLAFGLALRFARFRRSTPRARHAARN
jgi:hypothetical protein